MNAVWPIKDVKDKRTFHEEKKIPVNCKENFYLATSTLVLHSNDLSISAPCRISSPAKDNH
jgi:hypothetical protein